MQTHLKDATAIARRGAGGREDVKLEGQSSIWGRLPRPRSTFKASYPIQVFGTGTMPRKAEGDIRRVVIRYSVLRGPSSSLFLDFSRTNQFHVHTHT